MSFNITPVASGYQEIHTYSAMNIDSVKINTSLIMMKECPILTTAHAPHFPHKVVFWCTFWWSVCGVIAPSPAIVLVMVHDAPEVSVVCGAREGRVG